MKLIAAAIQMVSGRDVEANWQRAEALLGQAAAAGAQLAVLPEMFIQFGGSPAVLAGEEQRNGDIQQRLAALAKTLDLYLVAGTLPVAAADGRAHACCYALDNQGRTLACYRKIHLFDADVGDSQKSYRESAQYAPGDTPTVVDTPWGRLGLAVCYDIRFPELFRAMLTPGLDLLAVPAAFTRVTGWAHWLPLLRARAIENQCALIGANQGGIHDGGRETSGGSVIIDAWGRVLAEAGLGEACVLSEIDLAEQTALRQRMPALTHRRF